MPTSLLNRLRHEHLFVALALAAAVAMAVTAGLHSEFFNDDMAAVHLLRTKGAVAFLLWPVNIQVVPLHRVAMLALDGLFGVRYPAWCGFLLLVHVAGILLLYRVLTRLVTVPGRGSEHDGQPDVKERRLLPAILTCAYAVYPLTGIQFVWLSAGLHRLPYALATLFAFDRWLNYRTHGRRRELWLIGTALLTACCFYGKGPLLALHLLALELALWPGTASDRKRPHAIALLPFLALGAGWVVLNNSLVAHEPMHLSGGVQRLASLLPVSGKVFVASLVGDVSPFNGYRRLVRPGPVLGLSLVLFLFCVSVSSRRSHLRIWLLMLVCFSVNGAVVLLSNRSAKGLGVLAAQAHRYYFEQLPILVPLLALGLRDVGVPVALRRPLSVATGLCLSLVIFYNALAIRTLLETAYHEFGRSHAFYATLDAELARMRRAGTLDAAVFYPELMPPYLRGLSTDYTTMADMALTRAWPLNFDAAGTLLIEDDGTIAKVGPDFDPNRRLRLERDNRQRMREMFESMKEQRKAP